MRVIAIAAITIATGAAGCGGSEGVTRLVNGKPIASRFISDVAYARYVEGAEAEARGALDAALGLFEASAAEDPESADTWTRIGALRCKLGKSAATAFDEARKREAAYPILPREEAACLARSGDNKAALAAIERASALDPTDPKTAELRASILIALGRADDAARVRAELAARSTWVAPDRAPIALVDEALARGDLAGARRHARSAGVTGADLALRAAVLGRAAIAKEQAKLISSADPTNVSALIALVAALDLAGDTAALDEAVRAIPTDGAQPSLLARLAFTDLLARRSGAEAAKAYWGREGDEEKSQDPLIAGLAKRVYARLKRP